MLWLGQKGENSPGRIENKRIVFSAGALLLLFGLISFSTLAKASQYLPKANPAHHVSQASKMSLNSSERLGDAVALGQDLSDTGLCAPQAASGFVLEQALLPRDRSARDVLKDRSPPPFPC